MKSKYKILPFILFLSFLPFPIKAEKSYPRATFFEGYYKKYPTIFYKIQSLNQISTFNKIQDSIDYLKAQSNADYVYCNASIEFSAMNKEQIDSSFALITQKENIRTLIFRNCSFQELPDSLNSLTSLDAIHFIECDSLKSLGKFDPVVPIFEFYYYGCQISSLPEGIEKIHPLVRLLLHLPDTLFHFNLNKELGKFSKRNNLIDLSIRGKRIAEFPENIFTLTSLRSLMFETLEGLCYPRKYDKLVNLLKLTLTCWNEEVENSARKNSNFISYTPIEYIDNRLYSFNPMYNKMSEVFVNTDTYTYHDSYIIFYTPKNGKETIEEFTYYVGISKINISINYKEKKLYIKLPESKLNGKIFKASLFNWYQEKIQEGTKQADSIVIDLDNLKDTKYEIKLTIGRYSKQFYFYL